MNTPPRGPFIVQIVGLASGDAFDELVCLKSYDPDGNDGRGAVVMTRDVDQAQRFDTGGDALRLWRATSTVRPLRPDGRPNRPLTAFTILVMTLVEAKAEEARR